MDNSITPFKLSLIKEKILNLQKIIDSLNNEIDRKQEEKNLALEELEFYKSRLPEDKLPPTKKDENLFDDSSSSSNSLDSLDLEKEVYNGLKELLSEPMNAEGVSKKQLHAYLQKSKEMDVESWTIGRQVDALEKSGKLVQANKPNKRNKTYKILEDFNL